MGKLNKAFTLGEVLIVIVIIGVIMALSVKTLKMIKSSYTPLTYYAYYNVSDITNILLTSKLSQTTTVKCKDASGQTIQVLRPDNYAIPESIPNCSALPKGGSSNYYVCNAIVKDVVNLSKSMTTCTNVYQVDTTGSEPKIKNLASNIDKPTFTTLNGQRYYLTRNVKAISGKTKLGFRLMAVDLNGKTAPNIAEPNTTNKVPPDIVTFMIMDNGDVFPLGVAADNWEVAIDSKSPPTMQKYSYINAAMKGYCFPRGDEVDKDRSLWHCPLSSDYYEPAECSKKGCSFLIEKPVTPRTFRDAYCLTRSNINIAEDNTVTDNITYINYCTEAAAVGKAGTAFRAVCPPYSGKQEGTSGDAKSFDRCSFELVKPMFRYNFR